MKTNLRRGSAAFTLIELMAVITIIVILAALVVGGMSYVIERQAREKARVQMALLSKGLEEYKLDNGTYPPTDNSVPGYVKGPPDHSIAVYDLSGNSSTLLGALYQYGVTNTTKIYLPELDPATSKQGWTASGSTDIIDPWGKPYCYRTAFGKVPANGTAPANPDTQNPDFDLWSMGKDGVTDPLNKLKDDIRNF